MLFEYVILFLFLLVILILTLLIPFLSATVVYQENYQEKVSPYECGFEPFENNLSQFEIRYYLLAILFLIFDLEIVYLLPWLVMLPYLTYASIFGMLYFFFFLIVGFYYEWLMGGLEWD